MGPLSTQISDYISIIFCFPLLSHFPMFSTSSSEVFSRNLCALWKHALRSYNRHQTNSVKATLEVGIIYINDNMEMPSYRSASGSIDPVSMFNVTWTESNDRVCSTSEAWVLTVLSTDVLRSAMHRLSHIIITFITMRLWKYNNHSNNANINVNVYSAIMNSFGRLDEFWLECLLATNSQIKPINLGCRSTLRLLPSTSTITIYYYYSVDTHFTIQGRLS